MNSEIPATPDYIPPYFASRFRLFLLLVGNVCLGAISFVFGRHSFWLVVALLALGALCTYLAHGDFRGARLSSRQHALFIGGLVAVSVIAGLTDYVSVARTHSWLPLNPIFLWMSLFYMTVDLLKLKARNV